MNATAALLHTDASGLSNNNHAVAVEVRRGLTRTPKSLSPWLFYDEIGSRLFEQITELPEYYLTRTERSLLVQHADAILRAMGVDSESTQKLQPIAVKPMLNIAELGAGTAAKTRILLKALLRLQPRVVYQPIDVSASALACAQDLEKDMPRVSVSPLIADYVAEPYQITRVPRSKVLVLYIGSSIGNFAPQEAHAILQRLRKQLAPGDGLLLGTDLAPGLHKSEDMLRAAYDDSAGITARFNKNVLRRLNSEIGADFRLECFDHAVVWNAAESRMEMHLRSLQTQSVVLPANSAGPALTVKFEAGETIHTENSYKFTDQTVRAMLSHAGFGSQAIYSDDRQLFALHLARAM